MFRKLKFLAGLGLVASLFAPLAAWAHASLPADATNGSVTGDVRSSDSTPVVHALVRLIAGTAERDAYSDVAGHFRLLDVPARAYLVEVTAAGFARLSGLTIEVHSGSATQLGALLVRSSTSLTTLGRITTHAGDALSTTSALVQDLGTQQAAAQGTRSIADLLEQDAVSATVSRPNGASPNAPAVVALRGPDPTETLVDIDGHEINSGGSGAFDLSLLDPAVFSSVQLIYGVAPSSLVGPNTIDGAVNLRTLEPTAAAHGLARVSFGSFGAWTQTLQATGSAQNLGYALSLHRTTTRGEINDQHILTEEGTGATVGSALAGSDALAKVRYAFLKGAGFVTLTFLDQALSRDLSAALSSELLPTGAGSQAFSSFAGSSQAAHNASYGIDVQIPVGSPDATGAARTTLLVRHLTSAIDQSVVGPAAGTTLYLFNDRDLVHDDILAVDHLIPNGMLSAKLMVRTEALDTQQALAPAIDQAVTRHTLDAPATGPSPISPLNGLAQTERSGALRLSLDPSVHLHYSAALYYSSFSSFGTSLDPRVGLVWTPTAQTGIRFSIGSTFQSPQLPELYVPPVLPPPDADGHINIGNPDLKADHATDFGLGVEHIFASRLPARLSLDLYRSNLRTSAERFVPPVSCLPSFDPLPPPQACESFPINAGDAVYQGIETRFEHNLTPSLVLHATYSLNSAYPQTVSPSFQNGSLVVGQQFQGVPLHTLNFGIERETAQGLSYSLRLHHEDGNNALNRPAFTTAQAGAAWRLRSLELGVHASNLTNVYADRFTLAGQGVPYAGFDGPIATDAYSLEGRAFTFSVTRRW